MSTTKGDFLRGRMVEEVVDRCRICLDYEVTPDNPLLSPCACRGSQLYVHIQCLKRWMINSRSARCQICRTPYRIQISPISASMFLCTLMTSFWDRISRHGSIFCHDPDEVVWAGFTADLSGPRFRLVKAFSWLAIFHYMILVIVAMLLVKCLGMGPPTAFASFAVLLTAARLLVLLPINAYRGLRWVFCCSVCTAVAITCMDYGIQAVMDQLYSYPTGIADETWSAVTWEMLQMLCVSVLSCFPLACQVFSMHTYLTFRNLGSDAFVVTPASIS